MVENIMFDVVCMNPPYLSKQLVYLKFLKKAQDSAHYVLGLHPVMPFLDQRKKNKWTNLINTFSKDLDYLRVIHSKNSFPDVDIQALLCISFWKSNSNGLVYENDLTDVKQVIPNGNPDLYTMLKGYDSFWNKFWNLPKEDSIADWQIPKKHTLTEGFVVELSLVRGNIDKVGGKKFFKPDIFSFNPYNMKPKSAAETQSSNKNKFWFKTEGEADAFCKYLNTDFARGTLGVIKRDYNPKYTKTPKIDLSKPISDNDLYKQFNISADEQYFIKWILDK